MDYFPVVGNGYPYRNWLNTGAVFSDGSHMGTPVSHTAPILGWRVTPSVGAKRRGALMAADLSDFTARLEAARRGKFSWRTDSQSLLCFWSSGRLFPRVPQSGQNRRT